MAAMMASVGNDTMIDNPNQYATLDDDDDDDMSFGEASIGEIAGIMIVANSPDMDEDVSDDDSMPELRIRDGDDNSSDDDSDDDSDGDDDSSDDESSDDEESNSDNDSDILNHRVLTMNLAMDMTMTMTMTESWLAMQTTVAV